MAMDVGPVQIIPLVISGISLIGSLYSIVLSRRSDARAKRTEEATYPRIGVAVVDPALEAAQVVALRINQWHDQFMLEDVPESDAGAATGPLLQVRNFGTHPLPNLELSVFITFYPEKLGFKNRNTNRKNDLRIPLHGLGPNETSLVRIRNKTKSPIGISGNDVAYFHEGNRYFCIDSVASWGVDLNPTE